MFEFGAFKLFGTASDVDQLEQRVEELMQELERRDDDLRKANHQIEQLKTEQNVKLAKNNPATSSQLKTRHKVRWLYAVARAITHIFRSSVWKRQRHP
jgi:hypothetical protein